MLKRLGLIINPIAGMGGRAGLKGSDDYKIVEQARQLGIAPESNIRAGKTLDEIFLSKKNNIDIITAPGEMGEDVARKAGFNPIVVGNITPNNTNAKDTERIALIIKEFGVDLLLFAGGDGTARNIYNAVGNSIPVLGIPTGVKMQSAVFSTNHRAAASLVIKFLFNNITTSDLEVMDIDEEAYRQGKINSKLYGFLKVPNDKNLVQGVKVGGIVSDESSLNGIAHEIRDIMQKEEQYYYIFGPGTTIRSILEKNGLSKTLLGVDVVFNNEIYKMDTNAVELYDLVNEYPTKIVVAPIGGQGYVFGRGNQQISPEIIKKVGKSNIIVIASPEKLLSLRRSSLIVETGDKETDEMLKGAIRIITGYHTEQAWKIKIDLND